MRASADRSRIIFLARQATPSVQSHGHRRSPRTCRTSTSSIVTIRRCFGGRLPTKNDDTMTSSRQAHCVLSQYTLRAADHLPWGDIGEQENFHTNQCNG